VAKKEEERRKKVQQQKGAPAKVIRDGDLDHGPSPAPSRAAASPAPPSSGEPAASAPAAPADGRQAEEQAWKQRAAAARARVETAQKTFDRVNALWLAPGEYYVDANGKTVVRDLEHLRSLIETAKHELEAAKSAQDGLADEARRAGVPAGWVR